MALVLDVHPQFGTVGLALALALGAYALFGEPILGRRCYARLQRERDQDTEALVRFYRLVLAVDWAWTALVGIIVAVAPGVSAASVGIALPGGDHVWRAVGFTAYVAVIVAASSVLLRRRAVAGRAIPGQAAVTALLPRTSAQRRVAAAVALTAGICEELLYRGFLVAFAVAVFGASLLSAAIIATGVFALAHVYQGPSAVLATGVLGAGLAALYVSTGSLLLPIVIHVLVDLRGLVAVPPPHVRSA